MTSPTCPSYAGDRFPAEVISHAVCLLLRFPLSLRMLDELLAARGIVLSHETVRQRAVSTSMRPARTSLARNWPCPVTPRSTAPTRSGSGGT